MSTDVHAPATPTARPLSAPSLNGPTLVVLAIAGVWALTLDNSVFIDESLYIRAGRAYLDHWFAGSPLPAGTGSGFSGLPVVYPVLAGALDLVGGLAAVRAFSLLCIILTALLVRSIAGHLFTSRAGFVAGAMFVLTGPVMYVGHLATFDALVMLTLATALWVGIRHDGPMSTAALVALLVAAVLTKYAAYVFVVPVLVLVAFHPYQLVHSTQLRGWRPVPWRRRFLRSLVAGILVAACLVAVFERASAGERAALAFTTTQRDALSPAAPGFLVGLVPNFVWPLLLSAVVGIVFLAIASRWTAVLMGLVARGTALILPAGQVLLGEAVSFQKHLAYSAVFLAPFAGWGLVRPWRLAIWTPVLVWSLVLTGMWGMFRSHDLIQYPDVRPVVQTLDVSAGRVLSSSADSLAFYDRDDAGLEFDATFDLYPLGDEAVRRAVRDEVYDVVVIHAGATGSTLQDAGQAVLLEALRESPYQLETVGEDDEWLVYSKPGEGEGE